MRYGIHLANGPNNVAQLLSARASSFVALHTEQGDLRALRASPQLPQGSRFYTRVFGRQMLSWFPEQIESVCVPWANEPCDLIYGNEFNVPVEGSLYPPEEMAKRLEERLSFLKRRFPQARLHLPAFSPDFGGDFLNYYRVCQPFQELFDVVDLHLYGDLSWMVECQRKVMALFPNKPFVLTETNFGAGREVDLLAYASEHLLPLLARRPEAVESINWFIWKWYGPDQTIKTPLDLEGSALLSILREQAPMTGEDFVGDITLSVRNVTRLTPNYVPNRPRTVGIVIHTTRAGRATLQQEYASVVNYFLNPASSPLASAHFVVGPDEVTRLVHDQDIAWHARENNQTHLGVEICQPRIDTPITPFQYRATAEIVREWCEKYNIPKERVYTQYKSGIVGHEDTEQGKAYGKSDPGPAFDWTYFLESLSHWTPSPKGEKEGENMSANDHTFLLGEAFERALSLLERKGLGYGSPRHNVHYITIPEFGQEPVGAILFLTSTPKHPTGSVMLYRKFLNSVAVYDFSGKKAVVELGKGEVLT